MLSEDLDYILPEAIALDIEIQLVVHELLDEGVFLLHRLDVLLQ